jgi:protein-S-isoprenylcysteine O-methyltransferase Ste14
MLIAGFALLAYLATHLAALAFLAFLAGAPLPRVALGGPALLVDLGLVLVFGLQHSIMARPGFKKLLPAPIERSVYVAATAVVLLVLVYAWQPLPGAIWIGEGAARTALHGVFAAGALLLFAASAQIDGLALGGLRQALEHVGWLRPRRDEGLVARGLYRYMRHPIQAGWLVVLWATPDLSMSRLVLAAAMSAYIFVGIHFEERGLRRAFGEAYVDYAQRVGAFWPRSWA